MKLAPVWLLTVCCALEAAGAQKNPAATRLSGRDYLRVTDWAAANDFEARWVKKDETLQLSGRSNRLLLNVDSSDAEWNGVNVRLCYPVANRDGVPYLAVVDAQNTFEPLLDPPRYRPGLGVKTICLDPGHGGSDPGYRVSGNEEKKYTLLLAGELRDQLTRAGFKVILTRTRDATVEPSARPDMAGKRRADLFISLHFNSTPSSSATVRGVEVYCMTPVGAPSSNARGEGAGAGWSPGNRLNDRNMFLAYQLQKALVRGLGTEDRGVHRARFAVLRGANMPAVLIEGGFMSHPTEGRKIFSTAYRVQMARSILDGINAYKKLLEQR